MKEKVKQLCKEQGVTLKDVAEKVGIARESLTRALNGNPTLSTLQGIATALNVEVWQLFASSTEIETTLNGFVEFKGEIYQIRSKQDLDKLKSMIE